MLQSTACKLHVIGASYLFLGDGIAIVFCADLVIKNSTVANVDQGTSLAVATSSASLSWVPLTLPPFSTVLVKEKTPTVGLEATTTKFNALRSAD